LLNWRRGKVALEKASNGRKLGKEGWRGIVLEKYMGIDKSKRIWFTWLSISLRTSSLAIWSILIIRSSWKEHWWLNLSSLRCEWLATLK